MEMRVESTNDFGMDVTTVMSQRIAKSGVPGLSEPVNLTVCAEELLDRVADLLVMTIRIRKNREFDSTKVRKYLDTLIVYRIQQISGNLKVSARDVIVPCFMNPVLSAIGKYEDPMRSLRLHPITNVEPSLTWEEMRELGFMLSAAGVKVARGLPRVLMVDSDGIFRVQAVNGELRVAGSDVGELILLIRTVVNIEFAETVYGAARTRYLSLEDGIAPWESIIGLSVD